MGIEQIIITLSGMLLFKDLPQSSLRQLAGKIIVGNGNYYKNTVIITKGDTGYFPSLTGF